MRYYGRVGFSTTMETAPGVWAPVEETRPYYGDVVRNRRRWSDRNDSSNRDISVDNSISVVSDEYMTRNLGNMAFIEWAGKKWRIASFAIDWPRVTIELGGLYNGQ